MRVLDDKLAESGFAFPNRQGPELPLEYPRQQRVAEDARSNSQLALDSPGVEQERPQISKSPQREFGQKGQVFPIRVWSAKCYPWLRRHRDFSITLVDYLCYRFDCRV